ncbi:hypothetical protein [Acinetobacter lactucae]|uniref:hypothetical protein n=1 Tax=Acinetobacter lactucae TaxID=1785128 RepID=UPI0020775697|nr:hypothetical protein [Acinetobacter lactucae]
MDTNKIEETKEKSKFPSMLIFTIIYLGMIILYCLLDVKGMKTLRPNEWGDFLAGFFAPLVFMWLIYGYHQQGKELSLQLEEVKNSVKQQIKMVTLQQQELEAKYFAAKPFFKISNLRLEFTHEGGWTYDPQSNEPPEEPKEVTKLFFDLKNLGEVAKHLDVIDSKTFQQLDSEYEIKKDGTKHIFFYIEDIYTKELASKKEVEFYLTIHYFDIYGKEYKDFVMVRISDFDINLMEANLTLRKVDIG